MTLKRVPLVRRTALKPRAAQKRTAKKGQRKAPKPGFTDEVKSQARHRSGGMCELKCGRRATQFHHRQRREHGDHRLVNCLHVCTECHIPIIHANQGGISYLLGWLVHSWDDPADVPFRPD